MAKHTPGPWIVDTDNGGTYMVVADNDALPLIAGRLKREANARLISAAPDMLEALERLTLEIERGGSPPADVCDMISKARAAIAKAKGADNG